MTVSHSSLFFDHPVDIGCGDWRTNSVSVYNGYYISHNTISSCLHNPEFIIKQLQTNLENIAN